MSSLNTSTNSPAKLPVKIRAYGLLPITHRGYVIVQVCCFTAILLALAWLTLAPPDIDAYRKLAERAPATDQLPLELLAAALDNARMILLVILAVGALESVLMLRKFNAAEAQAKSQVKA
jgi:hypothetical protein